MTMIPSYDNYLKLVQTVDFKFSAMASYWDNERKGKTQLLSEINVLKNHIESVRSAIKTLSEIPTKSFSVDETERNIKQVWTKVYTANTVTEYISEALNLVSIHTATSTNSAKLKDIQEKMDVQIDKIKDQKYYKNWVRKADKLNFKIISEAMPESILSYSDYAIKEIIDLSSRIMWEPYKRYIMFHFYTIYKQENADSKIRRSRIEEFSDISNESGKMIEEWNNELSSYLEEQYVKLGSMQDKYDSYDEDSEERLLRRLEILKNEIIKEYVPEEWNAWFVNLEKENKQWHNIHSKEEIITDVREEYVLSYNNAHCKTDLSKNAYFRILADKISALYNEFVSIDNDYLKVRFPVLMHLDTLKYRFAVDMQGVLDVNKGEVNGLAQQIVASTISNMPVGKAKFVFCDPGNTGVFSTFRDVGKNESEGSKLCSYIVDVNAINQELDRISNEIGYTINNILKGTKTTLYQHNKARAFNSSPYEFLFLMDYPQNMTARSLQSLKNIVENGPKCGIFTFIFNAGGTLMELLKQEEKRLASEIAEKTHRFAYGKFIDNNECWLDSVEEIPAHEFDEFVVFYNEAIKDSQQLTVHLDELEGKINQNGEYRIPIGKNLGGEVEYMSFFGSCQDYLMSGATRIGKTNALHVIIYNTLKYVPDAELYLVDFKQGVEFAPYASLNHPVIKALAVESVPEFGYSVLKHIEEKIKATSELFINHSVKNWKEYNEKTGETIPVTLVILDEFQHLFDSDVGKECSRIIEVIAKEGGAFNVHIILATQSVSNVSGLTSAAKDNIFGRMVFYHSEPEYNSMLWGDSHLALTLSGDVKGQMVFATGDKNSQRLLQWALAKPMSTVQNELSKPLDAGRYPTKLLLSTVRENPFSVFNAIKNGKYYLEDIDSCDINIGNEVDVFSDELKNGLFTNRNRVVNGEIDSSYLKLRKKKNENILFVGNNESAAESCFQHAIYNVLAKQIACNNKDSIVLLAPEISSRLIKIADKFPEYIKYYGQEDDLSEINLENKEYVFVFGLQNFRSLSYQPDVQLLNARTEITRPRGVNNLMQRQVEKPSQTDGQMFQSAVESEAVHVIAWHNNMQNLSAMFGGDAKVSDFLYRFVHKIGFKMNDKNDSRLFINSDGCYELSKQAAIYVKLNRERVIRPYKAMDDVYCGELNNALKEMVDQKENE